MNNKKKAFKKMITLLLSAAIIMLNIPAQAFAENEGAFNADAQSSDEITSGAAVEIGSGGLTAFSDEDEQITDDFSTYGAGEYYATVALDYLTEDNSIFSNIFVEELTQVIITEDENETGKKNYTFILPVNYIKSTTYKAIKSFGYSFEKYGDETEYTDISGKEDYNDLIITDKTQFIKFDETSTTAYCYKYNIKMDSLSDKIYIYIGKTSTNERIELSIKSISSEAQVIERSNPDVYFELSTTQEELYFQNTQLLFSCKPITEDTPSSYIAEFTYNGETIQKTTASTQTASLKIVGSAAYDAMADGNKAGIDFVIANKDAHTLSVSARVGTVYANDENVYWSESKTIEINEAKQGITTIEPASLDPAFKYGGDDGVPNFYTGARYVIPYDAVLSMEEVTETNEIDTSSIDAKLKEITKRESVDFTVMEMGLNDTDGNPVDPIPVFGEGWGNVAVMTYDLTNIKDYDFSNMLVYRYKDGELIEQEMLPPAVNDSEQKLGVFSFSVAGDEPNGYFVFLQKDYSDFTNTTGSGWVSYETHLYDEADKINPNKYDSYISNNIVYDYLYSEGSNLYLALEPVDGKYIEALQYWDYAAEEYKTAYAAQYYIEGDEKYPKTIKIPVTSASAYIPVKVSADGNWEDMLLGINTNLPTALLKSPQLEAPEITVTNNDGEKVSALVNDGVAKVEMSSAAADANIKYTVTNSAGDVIYDDAVYSEPFNLSTANENGEVYTITAYTSTYGDVDLDSSDTVTYTVKFSKVGAYAYTAANPVIGTQLISGSELSDSVYRVVITDETQGVDIYYTLDGTEPTVESSKYTAPLTNVAGMTNGSPTVIKAIAVKEGYNDSETVQKTISFSTDWWDNLIQNTSYSIPVKMVKYGEENSLSMGNDAIAGNATFTVDANGNKTMTIPFQALNMGAIVADIIHFWYFPDTAGYYSNDWTNYLDYESDFTYKVSGAIDTATFPVYNSDELIPMALESSFTFMGMQRTYIKPDYSDVIFDVTGVKVENTEVDMPNIEVAYSYDNTYAEVTFNMDSASEYADADIYYLVSTDENAVLSPSPENLYNIGDIITIKAADVDEEGLINVYAMAVKDGRNSMVNTRKISIDLTAEGTTEDTSEDTSEDNSGSDTENPTPSEEKYWVNVDLWNANVNAASMGDKAFNENPRALISVKDGKITAQIATNPVSIEPYYSALQNMKYTNPSGQTQFVKPIKSAAINAFDGAQYHELEYLQVFEIELANMEDEYVNVAINVPYTPMDGISANVGGYINARLKLSWDTLTAAADDAELIPDENAAESSTEDSTESSTEDSTESSTEDSTENSTGDASDVPVKNALVYEVPIEMVQAFYPDAMSMGNDAIDGNARVTVADGKAVVEIDFKAVVYTGLYGHLLNMWTYPHTDSMNGDWFNDSNYETAVKIAKTYVDYGMNYTNGDMSQSEFLRTVSFVRDIEKEDYIYIRVSVDAMLPYDQVARINFDWDNAVLISGEETEGDSEKITESTSEDTSEDTSESTTGTSSSSGSGSTSSKTYEDGKYWMDIALWNANLDQASMGDCAFDNNRQALVTISGDTAYIQIGTNPVAVSGYTSALQDIKSDEVNINIDKTQKFTTNTRNDGTEHTFDYVSVFSFNLGDLTKEYIPVKINVPYTPMDGISANVGGYIDARLRLYWSTMEQAGSNAKLVADSTSASGSSSGGGGSGSVTSASNSDTGIKIEADGYILPDDVEFYIEELTSGETYKGAAELVGDKDFTLYSITADSAEKGENISPDGVATVYFPVNEGDGAVKIYRVTEAGSNTKAGLTELEYELSQDGLYYKVTVKEFGLFAVVRDGENEEEAENTIAVEEVVTADGTVLSFKDISGHWAKEYIIKAAELGLFSGIEENVFGPDVYTTRAMFVTVLGRLNGVSDRAAASVRFEDIKAEDYFFPYVSWAVKNDIVSGMSETVFAPYANITREQMAVILYNYVKNQGIELKEIYKTEFNDGGNISYWAENAVEALAAAGIINGRGDGSFDPKGSATRAEIAALLVRFIEEYMVETVSVNE